MTDSIVTFTRADGQSVRLSVSDLQFALSFRGEPVSTEGTNIIERVLEQTLSWSSSVEWTVPPTPPIHIDDGAPRNRHERRRMAKTGRREK